MPSVDYTPPPTVQKFMQDDSKIRILAGPIGSGKSVGSVMDVLRRCIVQPKSKKDGLRYSRWAIVRQSMPQLRDTTIKTFLDWVPDGVLGTWRTTEKVFYLNFNDIRAEIMFRALDTPADIRNLLSLELTGAWLNECREFHPELFHPLVGRLGRYPKQKSTEEKYWTGLIGDTNMPNVDSWWYHMMEGLDPYDKEHPEKPNGWSVYRQPSGRSAQAENLENLPDDYYDIGGKSDDFVRVYIDGEYGLTTEGFPVYDAVFSAATHTCPAATLNPIRSAAAPLLIGLDFGRTPAAVLCQTEYTGRLNVLDEITSENMGIETFCTMYLLPKLQLPKYKGMPVIIVCDPAGRQKSQINEDSPVDILRKMGFKHIIPAVTNKPERRQAALENLFLRQIAGKSHILIDSSAKMLLNGLKFGYIYGQDRKGEIRHTGNKPSVVKNKYSHVCEALEYVALHYNITGGQAVETRTPVKIGNMPRHKWFV